MPKSAVLDAKGALPTSLKRFLVILLLFSIGNSSDAFLLLRARSMGVSLAAIPILWAVLSISKLVWSYAGGVLSDRFPRARLIVIAWLVYAATYLALGWADRGWQAWLLFVIYGAFHGLSEPAEKALVKDLAPPQSRGTAFGSYNFIIGVASVPAGILTGWIWSAYSPRSALIVGASIALLAAMLLATWMRTSGREEAESIDSIAS